MKRWSHIACLSAAVAAVMVGGSRKSLAQTLVWDASGAAGAGTPVDSSGIWDLSTPDWTNGTTDVVWPNDSTNPTTPVYSAQFGNDANNPASGNDTPGLNEITLNAPIEVQNIDLSTGSDGSAYYIDNVLGGGSLQVDGNITKSTPSGELSIDGPMALPAGNHTIAINDSPGAVPELIIFSNITGAGSITQDNSQFASGSYGTLILTGNNSYTGGTTVTSGLMVADPSSLGSGPVAIGSVGTLSIGGLGTTAVGSATINNTITITRNTYTGGTDSGNTNNDYAHNPDALVSGNTGNPGAVITVPNLIIDSTDARIAADTSTLLLPNPLTAAADVNGSAVADFDGDYAGAIDLNGDNTAFAAAGNSIEIIGGVEVNAVNDAALGGAGSKLILNSGTIHITSALLASNPAFATNFGGHTIVNGTVGTGVDVDQGLTFTVNGLTGGGVGMRGGGTLDFEGTNTFTGTPYYDGVDDGPNEGTETDTTATGVVNFEPGSTTTQPGLRVRSATVNVAGILNVGGAYTSIGADSTGSNGTPDYGTVNITSGGSVIENSGDDFNVSDNANTKGTINLSGTGNLTVGGTLYIGKSAGATGTINMSDNSTLNANSLVFVGENNGTGVLNQSGGSINLTRNGNFTFVVSDGRNGTGSGLYNLSGGSFTSAGEVYAGEGVNGNGTWTQTGGTVLLENWFVVGRENATGTVNISGGTFTRSDGGALGDDPGSQTSIGDSPSTSGLVDTFNVSGTAQVNINTGETYVGNNGGSAVLNIGTAAGAMTGADATASMTVNNWFAIGRNGTSAGVVNVYDGTLTQATNNFFDISGDGGSPTGTVNVYGGTVNAYQMLIGENGSGQATLNIDGGNVNLPNNTVFANSGTVTGTLNLNGGTLTAYGFQANNGTVANGSGSLVEGAGTGTATFDFNGGTLVASTTNTSAFIGAKVTSVVSAGGAIINTNGYTDRINSVLTHDSTLSGADGGLTKQGAGTLTLAAANTYTGPTTISGGTLQYLDASENLASLSIANGAALDLSGAGTVTIATGLSNYLTDLQTGFANGAWNGTSATSGAIDSAFAGANAGVGVGYATSGTSGSPLTLRLTWFGDTDLDGTVTYAEINAITPMDSGGTWATGDFNYDGKVNEDDFSLAFLGAAEANGRSITKVAPEPAAFLVGLPAFFALIPRRSRRRGA